MKTSHTIHSSWLPHRFPCMNYPPRFKMGGMWVTLAYIFSRSSARLEQLISNSYMTGGMWSIGPPTISKILPRANRSIPSAVSFGEKSGQSQIFCCRASHGNPKQVSSHTWIRCLSITAAESLLIGRGVLLTTTLRIHCSQLTMIEIIKKWECPVQYRNENCWKHLNTYTTFSSWDTRPNSCRVARLSKKLSVKQPWESYQQIR